MGRKLVPVSASFTRMVCCPLLFFIRRDSELLDYKRRLVRENICRLLILKDRERAFYTKDALNILNIVNHVCASSFSYSFQYVINDIWSESGRRYMIKKE